MKMFPGKFFLKVVKYGGHNSNYTTSKLEQVLRPFALIVYAHPYYARNLCPNGMLRHARARAQRKKSIHMKG